MRKRLFLLAAATAVSFAVVAGPSWRSDFDLANIKLIAADRHLQAALSAANSTAALAELQLAINKYELAKSLFDQVVRQIEAESTPLGWSPKEFTSYGNAKRGSDRAKDGVSAATSEMVERIKNRGGAQPNR